MTDKRDRLVQWLRDAHAMEEQAETMLDAQASRIESYPQLRSRIEDHKAETQRQAKRIEDCLDKLGEDTSSMKDIAGKATAMFQGLSGMLVGDEVVKGAMASYTFEHFEVSAYKALIAAAEACGESAVAEVCRENLKEEEAMADWLAGQLPEVTAAYLAREQADVQAKR